MKRYGLGRPPDIAEGAGDGDLRTYLERLTPDQKQEALRALAAREAELGDDPATLGAISQAYAGLGKVKEARRAASAALRQSPDDPDARRLMGWVISREKLSGRIHGALSRQRPPQPVSRGPTPSRDLRAHPALDGYQEALSGPRS